MEIIVGRRGEQSFPIMDKAVSGKHLKLTTMSDGNVQVEDLGSTNGTFVDGVRIIKKVVSRNTVVQMGPTFTFRISDVIKKDVTAGGGEPAMKPKEEYSITHLENVWNNYEHDLAEIRAKSLAIGKKRMLPMMLGMASTALSPILAMILSLQTLYITVPVSLICLIMYIQAYNIKDTSSEDQKTAKAKYIQHYVCPNPHCKRYVGNLGEYMVLKQNKNCPYCKCNWTA